MALRNVDNALKNALVDNVSLQVYHLVKFEKPSNINYAKNNQTIPDTNYVYLTDAPYPVDFENQTYNPTHFGQIGDVSEDVEAKATGMTLALSANNLGRDAIVTLTCAQLAAGGSTTATVDLNLFESGFQIGDEIKFEGVGVNFTARLDRVRSDTSIDITAITATNAVSAVQTTATYTSASVTALTSSTSSLNFQSYINKTVDVYRCFANPKTGDLYGSPVLLFKGIIAKGALKEKGSGKSEMVWTLTSHWGDFVRVQGRLTSDDFHRALDATGTSNSDALLRDVYEFDKGFEHAEKSFSVLAPYIDTATRPKLRKKSSMFGLRQSYSMEEETYEIAQELDLNLNLAAKLIPAVYGVNRIEPIPVFADIELGPAGTVDDGTVSARNTTLYTANVISEGPIRAIYDVVVDDEGLVCRDENDQDTRGVGQPASNYTGSFCVGNMTLGDVLEGEYSFSLGYDDEGINTIPPQNASADPLDVQTDPSISTIILNQSWQNGEWVPNPFFQQNTSATANDFLSAGQIGITHEKRYSFNFGGDNDVIDLTFHAGFFNQLNDAKLTQISNSIGFQIQSLFYKPGAPQNEKISYWDSSHRLLDTAYVVQKDVISSSSGQQPKFDYIVKGKYVNCLNYDGSYKSISDQTRESNYNLGATVNLQIDNDSGFSAIIIDKWYLYDPWGKIDWRFRFGPVTSSSAYLEKFNKLEDGTAGTITMTLPGNTTVPWVMRSESFTGDTSNPAQTAATTSAGGSNFFDVGGLVIDGGTTFTLSSVDFIIQRDTQEKFGYIDAEDERSDYEDSIERLLGGSGSGGSGIEYVQRHLYGFDFHEIYNSAFASNAIKVAASKNQSVLIKFTVGTKDFSLNIPADKIARSLTSTRQGLFVVSQPNNENTNATFENIKTILQEQINAGNISTTRTTGSTNILRTDTSATYYQIDTIKFNNIPTTKVYGFGLIYQDSSDTFTPSTTADGLRIKFSRDDGGQFAPDATITQPSDSTLSSFCDTNEILVLNKDVVVFQHLSALTNLKYSYGAQSGEILEPEDGGTTQYEQVFSAQDARVTNNPALILLDYLTNTRFGKGLTTDLIDVASFKEAARTCDTGSDITVIAHMTAVLSNYQVGDVCRYPWDMAQPLIWEGTISKIETVSQVHWQNSQPLVTRNVRQITFTDCIGKLGTKWLKNHKFKNNEIVWTKAGNSTIMQNITDPVAISEPTTQFSSPPLLRNKTRSHTFHIDISKTQDLKIDPTISNPSASDFKDNTPFIAPSGNPVVKKLELNNGALRMVSGYSLYDSDEVKYWKYLGWESWEQRWVTRHQLNPVIDTSQKIFENVNSLLQQFNGILRYSNGKYFLDMKVKAKPIAEFDSDTEIITENDIIGDIKLEDKGISKTFNAFSAQMTDPALVFGTRTISFFNSEYLAQDKGIQRQGTYRAPAITNYFNLRINAQQALDESRAGLTISFQMPPKGYLLLAGNIIAITYSKFNWENKLFRIQSLKTKSNLLVNVVAKEHNDDAFILKHMANDLIQPYDEGNTNPSVQITRPINLLASQIVESDGAVGGIELTWENTGDYSPSTHDIEIWMNPNNGNFNGASHILTTKGTTIVDPILKEQGTTERWYWIRYKILPGLNSTSTSLDPLFSKYYPTKTEEGVRGFGTASLPERIHGLPKGATSNTPAKIASNSSDEFFSLSSSWETDPEFGGTIPSGAYAMQRLTEPTGAKRYQFVWNGVKIGNYKWRGPTNTHTLSDIKLVDGGEEYTIGSFQSSYSVTTTTATAGTRNWDYFAIKTTRTDGISQGSEEFVFDDYPAILASQGAPGNPADVTEANAVVDLSNVADNDTRELYVIFDHSVPKCFLAEWDTTTNNYGPDYWRDIGDGSATLDTAWTAISGTSFTRDSGYTITGVGTTFTTDFEQGDIVAYLSSPLTSSSTVVGETSAFVVKVVSDTEIRLDRFNTAPTTINYLYRTAYRPDTTNDAVIAQIDRGS